VQKRKVPLVLCVVVPALNEAENLRQLVPRILHHVGELDPKGQVLVVDDGSTDDTKAVLAALKAEYPQVHDIVLLRNLGKAAALQSGFTEAADRGAEIVVMMDADGQDDPAELPRLVAEIEGGADLVTGARTTRNDRFVKRSTSRLYNATTRKIAGTPGRDFNSGFKAMRIEVAQEIAPMLYGELHRYLTVIAHWLGYRVAEVTVVHHARMHGESKYGLARFWRGFIDLITVRFLMSYENRPSHLFGGIGAASFVIGFGILLYLTALKFAGQSIGERPLLIAGVLMVMVGVQLIVFGLMAELVVYARNRAPERRA
jgi:glycosyltransferase involved in cell wall biosynthesis